MFHLDMRDVDRFIHQDPCDCFKTWWHRQRAFISYKAPCFRIQFLQIQSRKFIRVICREIQQLFKDSLLTMWQLTGLLSVWLQSSITFSIILNLMVIVLIGNGILPMHTHVYSSGMFLCRSLDVFLIVLLS